MTYQETRRVLGEILDERARQDERWGTQNHPDGTGYAGVFPLPEGGWFPYGALADEFRHQCQQAAKVGRVTWADIILEEFFEALAEVNPVKLRAELVQLGAVAAAWIEAIDRRTT